ncbi:sialidase family protein [Schaalia sp. lx-100]|uniref:sialidase family protein n=1 Tax=Schaalia sp. lx-100 TaxID=2899081 RepID=UPI001E4335C6|nr:sialidase family protein [Schaalia sp. lx-100]MCD4557360.1 glycoside hydrolase [Schaalia sp. lx-100]
MQWTTLAQFSDPFPLSAFPQPLYRIPALTVTNTGRILVAYDVRSDWRDLPADFDIALRTSDDRGQTWSPARPLRAHTPGHGFGDASLIYDPHTDTVMCWYVGSQGKSYFTAEKGGEGLELWLASSTDHGNTWNHRDMSYLRPEYVAGMFCSSGNGAVAPDGTIFQTFVARIDGENYAICAHSSDHGQTWHMGEPIGPCCDENKVVVTPSGKLLLHARDTPYRRQAISEDNGRTFTQPHPVPALIEPGCNGGLICVGNTLIASICADSGGRARLSLHLSEDEGQTWSLPILVDCGATAYSVMTALDSDTCAMVWEADNYQRIVYATFDVNELRALCAFPATSHEQPLSVPSWEPRKGTPGYAHPPAVNAN